MCNKEQDIPCAIEWVDLEDRQTDSEVGGYLANHQAWAEYRGENRPGGCDVFNQFSKMNVARKSRYKRAPLNISETNLKKRLGNSDVIDRSDLAPRIEKLALGRGNQASDRRGVELRGDYEQ